jgi:hypothetical protein
MVGCADEVPHYYTSETVQEAATALRAAIAAQDGGANASGVSGNLPAGDTNDAVPLHNSPSQDTNAADPVEGTPGENPSDAVPLHNSPSQDTSAADPVEGTPGENPSDSRPVEQMPTQVLISARQLGDQSGEESIGHDMQEALAALQRITEKLMGERQQPKGPTVASARAPLDAVSPFIQTVLIYSGVLGGRSLL